MQGSRFCVSLFWNNDYKHLFWWALTLCKCGRSSHEVTKWFAENENKNICSNRSIGNSSFMHKYLSETFWFLESGRKKKVTFGRKSRIICVKMFVSYVSYQHFYRLRLHAACGISTFVLLKPLDTISSRVCADRNKKQHDLFLTLTRASARRCNNLKLKTGEKSSNRTEKKHNNNISVLCRNTHCQHFIHIHVTNSRICSRGPNSGGFSHDHWYRGSGQQQTVRTHHDCFFIFICRMHYVSHWFPGFEGGT